MTTWALIPCSKSKADKPCSAREMYWPSQQFKGAWQVAVARGEQPLILSAKHGLLLPESIIAPYDETLVGKPKTAKIAWTWGVLEVIVDSWTPAQDRFVCYAGRDYSEHLIPELRSLGFAVEEPLKGLGQGQRLGWFKRQLEGVA